MSKIPFTGCSAVRLSLLGLALLAPAASAQPVRTAGGGDPPGVVAPLPGLSPIGLTGQTAGDGFGSAVANAGDLNGDGYDDVAVGAWSNDAGGPFAGRAYVYFGGPALTNTPDVTLTGEAQDDNFGWSVAGAGDLNGDGYDDLLVGAPFNDAGGASAGRAYVFLGGPAMDATADLTITNVAAGDYFGWSVAGAGDVNGDGYADFMGGAPLFAANDRGRAYLYFGGSVLNDTPDVTITGVAGGDQAGTSVAGAGDVNADGYDDVIVGAPFNDAGGADAGRAYVFFGGSPMNATADVTLTGAAAGDRFGEAVAGAGDLNADGFDDVIVGADENDSGGTAVGRAYVFFGGSPMNNAADVTMTGTAAGDGFGHAVSTAGDADGDGYDDVVVSGWGNDAGGDGAGRAYVFLGGPAVDGAADAVVTGRALDSFGTSVSGGGDVDGDGRSEVVVGAFGYDNFRGRAAVLSVELVGEDLPDEFFNGAASLDFFGNSVSGAGDVNGDSYDDMIVGAYLNSAGGAFAGRAYVYFGGPGGADATADVTLTGAAAGDQFGNSVSGAGDVNGDGYDDVIVGAPRNDAGGADAGRAYVYFGGAAMNNTADVTLTGAAVADVFGHSVSGVGDVNGDGFDDVIVGAYGNDTVGLDAGRAYVYFGGAAMNNIADVTLTGVAIGDVFGSVVSRAGDVNGDGFDDVIVGASRNDAGGGDAGRAYVYFGGAAMNNTADVTLTGAAAGNQFGVSVSGAGDVNGDGYDDMIVGAWFNDGGGANAGRAYVYFGGAAMNAVADVTLTGEAAEDLFGSVSGAGDVNGDGYDDVIVGAPGNDTGGLGAGRAYVYFGGAAMDDTLDGTMAGEAADDHLGAVSGAGDVDGDGVADLLAGATGNDAGGSNAGRAYLYRSTYPPVVPRLVSIQDVPDDQGGFVTIEWARSAYDGEGDDRVTGYLVERSRPPAGGGFFWEPVATIPATERNGYSAVVPTYGVVPEGNSGPVFVQVTAQTASDGEFFRSTVESGVSTDDLAPPPPRNPRLSTDGGAVHLAWAPSEAPDVTAYAVYRSDDPGFTSADSLLAALLEETETAWTDPDADPEAPWFYRLAARDVNAKEGEPTEALSTTGPGSDLPEAFALHAPRPNPARGAVAFTYDVPEAGAVSLKVYDASGRLIAVLVEASEHAAGRFSVGLDGSGLASGVYLVRMAASGFAQTARFAVVR
jgi:hypothetical protein